MKHSRFKFTYYQDTGVQVTPPASVTATSPGPIAASPAASPSQNLKRKRADSESDKENQSPPRCSTKRKRTNEKATVTRVKNLLELAVQVLEQLEGSDSD
jgi:hypothetical protein